MFSLLSYSGFTTIPSPDRPLTAIDRDEANEKITDAKEELEAESVNCLVDEKNVPSVRLVEKLGFTYKGKTDVTGVILNRYNIDFFR